MVVGVALSLASGVLDGSTALPMHFVKRWKWENIWLAFCIFEMIVVPWTVAALFLPAPVGVYATVSNDLLLTIFLFGCGFGIGNMLFGLGITRLGMGLGNALVVSVTAVTGALVPLVLQHPDKLRTDAGHMLFVALAVLVAGIVLCSLAARERTEEKALLASVKPHLVSGIIICVTAGFFSPCVNYAFAFGQPLGTAAVETGAGPATSSIAILVPMLIGAFVVSALYCGFLLTRHRTWTDFAGPHAGTNWICGFFMGCFNCSAFLVYGVATVYLGSIGPVIGWPIYMAMIILTSNTWGWIRGEWRGCGPRTYGKLLCGMGLIVVAIYLVSRVQ